MSKHVSFPGRNYLLVCVYERFISTIAEKRMKDVVVTFGIDPFLQTLQSVENIFPRNYEYANFLFTCTSWSPYASDRL